MQLISPLPDLIVSVGYQSRGATRLNPQQMLFKSGGELGSPHPLLRLGGPRDYEPPRMLRQPRHLMPTGGKGTAQR